MFLILIFFSTVLDYFKVKRFLLDSYTDYVYLKPKGLELFSKTLINDIKKIINENKLAIGTVQFGLDYGINNKSGKLKNKEIIKILKYCLKKYNNN